MVEPFSIGQHVRVIQHKQFKMAGPLALSNRPVVALDVDEVTGDIFMVSSRRARAEACPSTLFRGRVAATPRPRRGYSVETSRGAGAAAIFRGDESRRRHGRDVLTS